MNPLVAQMIHSPFPDVTKAIRSRVRQITIEWEEAVRHAMPQMRHLSFDEIKDSTPEILMAMADALGSDNPDVVRELIERAPRQGLSRWALDLDVVEVMQEDRLMRSIIVKNIDESMGRRLTAAESQALHVVIDVMLQRSVIAMVEQQKAQLRKSAETELLFLSFLSHDLNNNLGGVSMWLEVLSSKLKKAGGLTEIEDNLQRARKCIDNTVTGMRRLLQHERLRKATVVPLRSEIDLHEIAIRITGQLSMQAAECDCRLVVDIPRNTKIESNEELISLVLQNLIGNALKFGKGGTVCVGFDQDAVNGEQAIWVSDEGPGIALEQQKDIFLAFKRGETHGQHGLGLGLAIASHAAVLLGGQLSVKSQVGEGSRFQLVFQTGEPELRILETKNDVTDGADWSS